MSQSEPLAERGTQPTTTPIERGQTWQCSESAVADQLPDPWNRPYEAAGIAEYARFRVAVEGVTDGVAELTVTFGNGHPRTPATGTTLDIATDKLHTDARWARLDREEP